MAENNGYDPNQPRDTDGKWTDGAAEEKKGYDSRKDTTVERAAEKAKEKERFKISLNFFAERGLKNQSAKELRKGIKSLKEKIELHNEKIRNPRAYCKNWDERSRAAQEGLIRYWKKELINQKTELTSEKDGSENWEKA